MRSSSTRRSLDTRRNPRNRVAPGLVVRVGCAGPIPGGRMPERTRQFVLLLAVAALVAALGIGAVIAAGAIKNVPSTVTISSGTATQFKGKVKAGRKHCRIGRKVKLVRIAYP